MSSPLDAFLPSWASAALGAVERPEVFFVLGVGSAGLFFLSLLGVPWFLARVPADYFAPAPDPARDSSEPAVDARRLKRRAALRYVLHALKNLFGLALFVAGFVLLFTPGQGLLTLFAASFFLDFPGKHRMQRWVVARPAVLRTINTLRRRRGRPPLVL